jgi:hypothetical protein
MSAATTPQPPPPVHPAIAPAKEADYNRLHLDYHAPIPRPKVKGIVIDAHTHLLAVRHAQTWFEAGDHYGVDAYVTMAPLEEALGLQRIWGDRLQFIAIPSWQNPSVDDWLRRIEAFYNLGSRIVKFHMAPGTMATRKYRLDSDELRPVVKEAADRGMILMSHVGDPDTWYNGKYAADVAKFGTRDDHYRMWENVMSQYPDHPWWGAHMGGNPENLPRLQSLLDRYPNLYLDLSATKWIAREVSARHVAAREFVLRNVDRLMWGSDQVSGDDRGFDFLASRLWVHRKLWETDYVGPSPIFDPDAPPENQPQLHGVALPDAAIQKLYHDNVIKLLARVGETRWQGS